MDDLEEEEEFCIGDSGIGSGFGSGLGEYKQQ